MGKCPFCPLKVNILEDLGYLATVVCAVPKGVVTDYCGVQLMYSAKQVVEYKALFSLG
jgi:hypothetical protein